MSNATILPGLDCGLCGFRRCDDLAARLERHPELLSRCIHLDQGSHAPGQPRQSEPSSSPKARRPEARADAAAATISLPTVAPAAAPGALDRQDSLGRDFDFYLEHFPEEPGPRETILPHNPLLTRELDVRVGDLLIGRPLGMSCGCPVTHCGIATAVDPRTGVITWCVTGPLGVRSRGFKDLGYYAAEAYEGLVRRTRRELRIGERYFFQPRMCMLQWRHSGLLNYLNRGGDALQVRLEGLWIG